MTPQQIEALKLALGQLQAGFVGNAMQILREALAEHAMQEVQRLGQEIEQEPAELCQYGQEPASCTSNPMDCQCAIDAALAQPEQEPVADDIASILACRDMLDAQPVPPQPEQEPVAHLWKCLGRWSAYLVSNGEQADCAPPSWLVDAVNNATTPPQRTWVGLKDEEIDYFIVHRLTIATKNNLAALIRICEAKLKEKNQ